MAIDGRERSTPHAVSRERQAEDGETPTYLMRAG